MLTANVGISTQGREGGITYADPLLIPPEHRDAHPLTKLEPHMVRKGPTTLLMREIDGTLEWSAACLGYLVGSVRVSLRATLLRGDVRPEGGICLLVRRERLEPELVAPIE